jgi:hypothetical protein
LRILAEAGCNILELQSHSGHTLSELQKYIDRVDKRFAADRTSEKVTAQSEAEIRQENRSETIEIIWVWRSQQDSNLQPAE